MSQAVGRRHLQMLQEGIVLLKLPTDTFRTTLLPSFPHPLLPRASPRSLHGWPKVIQEPWGRGGDSAHIARPDPASEAALENVQVLPNVRAQKDVTGEDKRVDASRAQRPSRAKAPSLMLWSAGVCHPAPPKHRGLKRGQKTTPKCE